MSLESKFLQLLDGKQIVATVCLQFGDTGKGKFSDLLALYWADVTARGTGGANAGHTVVINRVEYIFHLLPVGILYDDLGKVTILGKGMVPNPFALVEELEYLDSLGKSYNNLRISGDAALLLPYHIEADGKNKNQKTGGIGTTGRGIGPCYEDKVGRRAIFVRDLLQRDILVRKLQKLNEDFPDRNIDVDDLVSRLDSVAQRLNQFITNTDDVLLEAIRQGKKIGLEGAQGTLLSIEHGISPYVTSSDCSVNGLASGVGLSAGAIDLTLGMIKFPIMTRVGGGPFVTELGGRRSEEYCADENDRKKQELERFNISYTLDRDKIHYDHSDPKILALLNSKIPFEQGVGARLAADEFGATTGRKRRTGWVDAVAARYAALHNNVNLRLVLGKLDAWSGIQEFNICYGYRKPSGEITDKFSRDPDVMYQMEPVLKPYQGYCGDLIDVHRGLDLPIGLYKGIEEFQNFVGVPVAMLSIGRQQSDVVFWK